jgi:hypothetical protein
VTGFERATSGEIGDLVADFMDDRELPGADCDTVVEIRGAGSSAVHLHCPLVSGTLTMRSVPVLP